MKESFDPSVLSPEYFELLLCQKAKHIYSDLATTEGSSSNDIIIKEGEPKIAFYKRAYALPLNFCLYPIWLFRHEVGVGPVLKVTADFMFDAYYVLSKADDSNIRSLNQDELILAYKEFDPSSILKERIFKFTRKIAKNFPLNPRWTGVEGNIYRLNNVPILFKQMAIELKIENLMPSTDSLIRKMKNTDQSTPQAPENLMSKFFQDIFERGEYKKEDEIVSKFKRRLSESYSKCLKKRYFESFFSPLLHILQSSGYGKSRLAIQLGANIPVIYSSLLKGQGYPYKSIYMTKLLKFFSRKFKEANNFTSDEGCVLIFTSILRILYVILSSPLAQKMGNGEKNVLKIDECINSYSECKNLSSEEIFQAIINGIMDVKLKNVSFDDILSPVSLPIECQNFTWKVKGLCILTTTSIENEVSLQIDNLRKIYVCDGSSSKVSLPMLIVIDEADALLYSDGNKDLLWQFLDEQAVAGFNVFRRMFRNFSFFWKNMWPVFISTNGKISNFLAEIFRDPSRKPALTSTVVPPFELVETFGIHLDHNESYSRPDWNVYLQSSQRAFDMYKCGRPLVYDSLISSYSADVKIDDKFLDTASNDCKEIEFYSAKIFGALSSEKILIVEKPNDHQVFAVFGLSVAFDDFPKNINRDILISSHMMTLLGYNNISETVNGVYPPEGMLNAVASWHLCCHLTPYLDTILSNDSLVDSGTLGELICKVNLLHARLFVPSLSLDSSYFKYALTYPIRRQLTGYVGIEEFFTSLTGNAELTEKYLQANTKLRNSRLSFSYFHTWQDDVHDLDGLLGECIVRGCALQMKAHYEGIDLMIPLVLSDGRLSFIALQAKLWISHLTPKCTRKIDLLHSKMRFENIFQRVELPKPRPYGCILQNVYNSSKELSCEFREGWETVEELPPCIFICGAYSASMNDKCRVTLNDYCLSKIPIVKVMKGLTEDDFKRKSDILRCYYGATLMREIS